MVMLTLSEAQFAVGEAKFSAYACLDTTGTREIFDVLHPRLNENQRRTYGWSRAQQSPAVTMTLRGVRVNEVERDKQHKIVSKELAEKLEQIAHMPLVLEKWSGTELETGFCTGDEPPKLTKTGKLAKRQPVPNRVKRHKWPRGVDPAIARCEFCGTARTKPTLFEATSAHQCKKLLYEDLKAPIQRSKEGTISSDDDALDRIRKKRPALHALIEGILDARDLQKQAGFLSTRLSPQGRFHSSFNVAAPWTGRWSSSKDPFGIGGNKQNVGERHRHIFLADPGYEMFYADLKTAESLKVAYRSGDEGYIEAHKGDVHTYVCREVWPELPWTGDIAKDKIIASTHYPEWDNVPGHDFRFQSKRIQHGSNYGLTPPGIAIIARIPIQAARHAQERYFEAFPEIPEWQKWTRGRIMDNLPIITSLDREVHLLGRPWDGHTHKQGYSFDPQSHVGDILNCGLWNVWNFCDPELIQLLAQVHDAILGQYLVEHREAAHAALRHYMQIPTFVTDFRGVEREMMIPVEIAAGYNWGKYNDKPEKGRINLNGLKEVK